MAEVKGKYGAAGRIVGLAVVAAITFFIARYLVRSWHEIPFSQFRFGPGWLALSFLGLVASFAFTIKAWQTIMSSMDQNAGYRSSWWVITGSYLAKYIPGHVWAIGGRMWLCKKEGIAEKYSGTGMLLEMMLLLLSALIIFGTGLPLLSSHGLPRWGWLMLIPVPLVALLLFTPLMRWMLRKMAGIALKREVSLDIDQGRLGYALALFLASSVVQGAAFFALVRSIYPIETAILPELVALYNGAWAAGFLSIIAPGGLGVREGALVLLLQPYIPATVAIILAAVARLWMTVFEISMALVGLYMRKTR